MTRKIQYMSNHERFFQLLDQVKGRIREHGPYTKYSRTTVFARAPLPRDVEQELSVEDMAFSLAAAQDCCRTAQPEGPVSDDLLLCERLWETTITVLEEILDGGKLDQETYGWGIYGLASGHQEPPTRAAANRKPVSSFKYRLQAALSALPSLNRSSRNEYVLNERTGVERLVKARKEVHLCTVLLLMRFRQDQWRCIRWWHAIAVAERWLRSLGSHDVEAPGGGEEDNSVSFRFP